jgi:putative oxidoreductase
MNSGIIPASWTGPLQALLRVVTGLLFVEHGTVKLFGFPQASGMENLPPLLMVAAILEVVGGILVTVGFLTRWAAFLLAGEMAIAYFMAHFPKTFWPVGNGGEAAILFCFIFLFFAAAGAGPFSVDDSRKA